MLQQEKLEYFVVATGQAHMVREFAEKAFEAVGLNWKDYVKTDKRFSDL